MPNSSGEEAIISLDGEYDYITRYNLDPENLITPPKKITKTTFSQDKKTGRWTKTEREETNPNTLPSDIRKKEVDSRNKLIKDLTEQAKELDDKLISINTQINNKKSLIISTLTSAVSGGCSFTPGGASNINGTGVAVGIGSTVISDTANIKVYPKIKNYNATSPFESKDVEGLNSSNSGTGYKTVIGNNDGTSLTSTYNTIDPNPLFPPIIPPTANCQNLYDKITTLANEINSLRSQRDSVDLVNLNEIKDEKTGQEVRRWGLAAGDESIANRKNKIRNSQTSIRNV
jgi:hypothetical protein